MENHADLVLTIEEKGSEAFYREAVNVITQYRSLLGKPGKKLKDNFRQMRIHIVLCAALLAICVVLSVLHGRSSLLIAGSILTCFAALISLICLRSMNRLLQSLMNDKHTSVVTLDGQGIELKKIYARTVRLAWSNIAFIRVFEESVCVLSRDSTGFVLSIERLYENEILTWLRDNRPEVMIIPHS